MKTLTIILLTAISQSVATAQQIIPRVGLSLSSIEMGEGFVGPEYQAKYRMGFAAGVEARQMLTEKFGAAITLQYAQKGWRGSGLFNTVPYEDDLRLDYLDISILPFLKVESFYFMAGPVVAIGIGGKTVQVQHWTNADIVYKGKPDFDKRVGIAGQVVFGMIIRERIVVDIGYQRFLSNYFDTINNTPSKLMSFRLSAGYIIRPNTSTK